MNSNFVLQEHHLDFDLALFTTYASTLKQTMRFVFQTILYRLFREDRIETTSIDFTKAIDKLAFQKEDSLPLGLLMKSIFLRTDLNTPSEVAKLKESICNKFGINSD